MYSLYLVSEECCQSKKVGSHTYTFNKIQNNFLPNSLYIFRDGEGDILYCFVSGDEQMSCIEASGESFFCEFVFMCVAFTNTYKSFEHEYPNQYFQNNYDKLGSSVWRKWKGDQK